jgi:hypothetical protein
MIRNWLCGATILVVACNNPPTKPEAVPEPPRLASAVPKELDAGPAVAARTEGGVRVALAPADADAIATIRTERLKAKNEGRVLVVYVGAGWCEPCRALKREIESGRLDQRLSKITLLAFDADRDADRLAGGGYAFKFIPYVALPGADGHVAESQAATGHGKDAWRELLGKLDDWQK